MSADAYHGGPDPVEQIAADYADYLAHLDAAQADQCRADAVSTVDMPVLPPRLTHPPTQRKGPPS